MRFLKRLIERAAAAPVSNVESVPENAIEASEAIQPTDVAEEGRKEKARLRDILTSKEAIGREKLAQVLALATELSAAEARKVLANYPCEVAASSVAADFLARHEKENPQLWAPQTQLSISDTIARIRTAHAVASGDRYKRASESWKR